jgi:uncharacterized protein (DUF934 family)
MAIVNNTCEVVEDDWVRYDRRVPIGRAGGIIVNIANLIKYREFFRRTKFQLSVEFAVTIAIEEIEDWLPRLDLVILIFDNFTDGRAFSQARILRERYHYEGIIRAQGELLRDQLSFMQRCGINQFDLGAGEDLPLSSRTPLLTSAKVISRS